jgi:glutathione S-transferase
MTGVAVPNQQSARYCIVAGPGSPYSHKVRAVMRYRHIPHDWKIVLGGFDGTAQTDGIRRYGKGMFPIVLFPDGTPHADSTPIIHELETRHAGRSVMPATPAQRFLARLIEDFADEWLPVPLMAFRWTSDEDVNFCARRQMHGWLGAVSEETLKAGMDRFTSRQQKVRMALGGANPELTPILHSLFEEFVDALEAGLSHQMFLFGERPSIADFGLYGMLSQFVVDPTPASAIRARAVRLYQWTHYVDDLSGHDGDWSTEVANETVRALVRLAGKTLLPMMLANAQAVAADQPLMKYELGGVTVTAIARPYPMHCWQWLKQMFAGLPPDERASIKNLLEESGFREALALAPGEADRVPPFEMA